MALSLWLLLGAFIGCAYQATLPQNVVEVYFVADGQVVQRYVNEITTGSTSTKIAQAKDNLRADLDYLITEMNKMYASLEPKGINIQLSKRKVDILDYAIFGDNEDVDPGLKKFDAWLLQENAYATLQYDAAIFFTGFELVDKGDTGVAGYAHVGQVCKNVNSSGIVEYDLTYLTAVTTAHELGHILGAGHDSSATGFVMIPTSSSREENRWAFSLCTREAFEAVIGKLDTNCLATSNAASSTPDADVTDSLANPDTICRRAANNQNSYMCKSSSFYDPGPHGDAVCKQIWCNKVGSTYCNSAFSSDGLICGTNKRCEKGSCVDHPDAESGAVEDENCIWGDQGSVSYNTNYGPYNGDCPGFIDLMGKTACETPSVAASCCKTCGDLQTGIPGCPYGDSFGSCNDYTQSQICDNYAHICCEFCHGYRKKRDAGDGSGVTLPPNAGQVEIKDKLTPKPDENKPKDEGTPEAMA